MTKPLRVTASVAILIFCLVSLALCVIYVVQLRLERRSEALLNDVGSLKLEVSTGADVMAIVQKYQGFEITDGWNSGCGPYDSSYAAVIRNDSINRIGLRFPILRFAVKPQGAAAQFMLKEGRLHCLIFRVYSFPPHDWKQLTVRAQAYPDQPGLEWPPSVPFGVEYESGNVWIFFTNLRPGATPEERRRAFDFDLSCMRRIGGCVAACEMMPTAWQEYLKKVREGGLTIPRQDLADSRCANRVATEPSPAPN